MHFSFFLCITWCLNTNEESARLIRILLRIIEGEIARGIRGIFDSWQFVGTFVCIPAFFYAVAFGQPVDCMRGSCDSWKMCCVRAYDNVTICMTKKKAEHRILGDYIQIMCMCICMCRQTRMIVDIIL